MSADFQAHLRHISARRVSRSHYTERPTIRKMIRDRREAERHRMIAWLNVVLAALMIGTAIAFVMSEPHAYYFLIALAIWFAGHVHAAVKNFKTARSYEAREEENPA
jgi:hypothetical protein